MAKVVPQVGIPPLLNWLRHYLALGGYQALSPLGRAIAQWSRESDNPQQGYQLRRWAMLGITDLEMIMRKSQGFDTILLTSTQRPTTLK